MFTESTIQKPLLELRHDYQLCNSYVFGWESDYFGLTKSGYAIEIEIKISLSDFRADFKKQEKHIQLQNPAGWYQSWRSESVSKCGIHEGKYFYGAECCQVRFKKRFAPNRFYYCVPDYLVDKIELPIYAGLYVVSVDTRYVNSLKVEKVKEAPLLHKTKHDLRDTLLDKFYWLSINQRQLINSMKKEINTLHF